MITTVPRSGWRLSYPMHQFLNWLFHILLQSTQHKHHFIQQFDCVLLRVMNETRSLFFDHSNNKHLPMSKWVMTVLKSVNYTRVVSRRLLSRIYVLVRFWYYVAYLVLLILLFFTIKYNLCLCCLSFDFPIPLSIVIIPRPRKAI